MDTLAHTLHWDDTVTMCALISNVVCVWGDITHRFTRLRVHRWCERMAHLAIIADHGQMLTMHMGLQCCVCTFHPCATVARWRNKNVWARDSRCHKGIAYSKHMPLVVCVTNNNCIVTTPPWHQHCHIATLPSTGRNGNLLDPDVSVPIVIFSDVSEQSTHTEVNPSQILICTLATGNF